MTIKYSIYKKNNYYCIKKDINGKFKTLGDVNREVTRLKRLELN